jgi:hypothetical protein
MLANALGSGAWKMGHWQVGFLLAMRERHVKKQNSFCKWKNLWEDAA